MVVLSRVLRYRANRRANIAAGAFLAAVQIVTLFVGTPTLAYLFFDRHIGGCRLVRMEVV